MAMEDLERKPMDLEPFAQHLRERDRAAATVQSYCRELVRFAAWFQQTNGQALTPAALTGRDVREYREHCQVVARSAPATVNRRLVAIRAYGAWLVHSGQLEHDPTEHVKLIEEQRLAPKSLDRRQLAALEREIERSLNAASTDAARFRLARDRAIFMLLANSGLRVAELCALTMADVVIGERSGKVIVRRGKGNKQREVPLNVEARRPLTAWFGYLEQTMQESDPLFRDRQGVPLRPRGVQDMLTQYGRRAGVEVTPHTLRHSFAKGLADAGVRAEEIAALLGHSKLETTRRYTQPTGRDLAAAVERLED